MGVVLESNLAKFYDTDEKSAMMVTQNESTRDGFLYISFFNAIHK